MMVPDRHYSHYVVAHSYEEVEDEEQEVSVVLQAKTVVNPS